MELTGDNIIYESAQAAYLPDAAAGNRGLLAAAVAAKPLDSLIRKRLLNQLKLRSCEPVALMHWGAEGEQLSIETPGKRWIAFLNGHFALDIDPDLLGRLVHSFHADAFSIYVDPSIAAGSERIIRTSDYSVVGLRRHYYDAVQPSSLSPQWPHILLLRSRAWDRLSGIIEAEDGFDRLSSEIAAASLTHKALRIGGLLWDLGTEAGLLEVMRSQLRSPQPPPTGHGRTIGPVLCGTDVQIEPGVILAGPAVICSGALIRSGAVISNSIVGPGIEIAPGHVLRNRAILDDRQPRGSRPHPAECSHAGPSYRCWPRWSYPRIPKRAADLACSLMVLVLFAAILPIIAIAIKLDSAGPVFFGHARQGLHGRKFKCLKFRTMRMGSDGLQDKLRRVNQVDGPQFKMDNDPRTTRVGDFLRETSIDEIPQFINVLLGHMSVIGPRPSPEAENAQCPYWRDARLSVRPGITGLWQIERTREQGKDFQEWLHYDCRYVRKLGLRLDLILCLKTFRKLIKDFVSQF